MSSSDRENGNECFKLKQYDQAKEWYSKAIEKDQLDYLALTNRSIVNYQLESYESATDDANKAIAINGQWYKAYVRKAKALKQLQAYRDAIDCLELALSLLENNNVVVDKTLIAMINTELTGVYTTLIDTRYKTITQGMDVYVEYIDKIKGKGVMARCSKKSNQELFNESPLVSSISYEYIGDDMYRHCSHCLATDLDVRLFGEKDKAVHSMIYGQSPPPRHMKKCDGEACKEWFCSDKCCLDAWDKYHSIVCSPSTREHIDQFHSQCKKYKQTNPLVILKMFTMIVSNVIQHNMMIQDALLPFTSFISNGQWQTAHDEEMLTLINLMLSEKCSTRQDLTTNLFTIERYRQFNAIIQCNASRIHPPSDVHLLVNDMVAKTPLSVDYIELPPGTKIPIDELGNYLERMDRLSINGSGLFPITNSCNHNCDPNAVVTYSSNNNTVTMRTLRQIMPGDSIEISYIDEDQSRPQRQRQLLEKYLFRCGCRKCTIGRD
ncbi:hypothetical protein SAMD00019534_030500 [Acytostelium subglobosum LB1]|uniref:hypothetical protein n=1 Tax=Acytostelium subglobosum LB1 TaxID=1410327 RepID=UPI000645037B|nr:hypothetical protein SAMD00019534_030500 [Acytostelium subglobosum LB1]GAM19875.1 hypothetical protein SAMD00019534_030500 [Acytostelium subglobosum LB1]|eukprot:XP_012756637.1 hypothetical protein SAMD00019534_030500 [Acytostelium subglobosum LB1]